MKNIAKYTVISIFILMLCTACPHNKGAYPDITSGSQDSVPSAPYVEGGISLVVSQDKKTININVKSSNGTPIELEECTASSVPHDTYENVTAKNRIIILKPQTGADIIGLNCPNQAVLKINASGCKTLTSLTCNKNLLDSLILPADSQLTHLACAENKLTALNIQACKNLESLECGNNKLTSLDLSGLNKLTKAECWQNNLTELKLTGCTALTNLDCETNNLSALNLSNLTALTEVNCKSNKLTELTVTGCTELKQIECYNNNLKENAFTTLLNTLPNRTSAETEGKIVLCKKEGETGNVTVFTTPEALTNAVTDAKNKNWKLYKKTGTDTDQEI
ncbi:leucine-rich repeat domain-containing protein [Treponema sp. OMZ 788]|uniref:leucine-rich repeat domain-containing protein n=1 Tax=Treponema sp. OMZ 788 TaxID=2563664 RepID=UPI0020A241B8|nr:hypothetical protein [Treponema sp. OMZ 788]UTC64438.1 leucine-rich repeat domain-containing protein [Treponema sp. OMZ 788]